MANEILAGAVFNAGQVIAGVDANNPPYVGPPPPPLSYVLVGAFNENSGAGSVYVYDPSDLSALPTKLAPPELDSGDSFGSSLAMNSQYVFVGADGDDDISTSSGSVYAYDGSDLSAAPIKLTSPEDSVNYDQFGDDIFAFENTLVVGAYRQISNGVGSGSVFVYDTTDLSATPTKLTESAGESGDYFGRGLAVTETQIIVSSAEDNENGTNSGSVFVYDKGDLSAAPTKLTPPDAIEKHYFGVSVVATSSKIIVGAFRDDSVATEAGAAYVYDASNLSASPTKLTPPGGVDWDHFGGTVAVKEDCLVISMVQDDDNGSSSGSIFVYDLTDLSAAPTKITAYDGSASDMFGNKVSITSDRIYVSVYDDEVANNSGSVYVYDRSDLSAQPSKITAFDAEANDFFGHGLLAHN
jgi:hypothetical protein